MTSRKSSSSKDGVDVSFRNGDAFDLLEEIISGRPSLSRSLRQNDDDEHPGYSNESFRNLDDAIAQAMHNSLVDAEHGEECSSPTQSRQSSRKSGTCFESFSNLDDAIQTALQNSLSDNQKDELRRASRNGSGGRESFFKSFKDLDNAIQLAVINSLNEGQKGLSRRLSVLSEESNDLDPIERETVRSATKALDEAVEQARQVEEMRKYGCSSMQSLRDLKSAMQASMQTDEDHGSLKGEKKSDATHVERGGRRRSLLADLSEEGAVQGVDISNAFEENDAIDDIPDRKCAMSEGSIRWKNAEEELHDRKSALSDGDISWKQHGCESLQSYRNLKHAIAVSQNMEPSHTPREDKGGVKEIPHKRLSMSDGDIVWDGELPDNRDNKRSAMGHKDYWRQHGCNSLQSYRNLKHAMEASLEDVEEELGRKKQNDLGPVRRRSIIDEMLDEGSEEVVETFKPQHQPSRRKCGDKMHASTSGIPSNYSGELEQAMHASLKEVKGGLSTSFRQALVGLNGDLDEDEAFARAMQMSKCLDVTDAATADENEVEEEADEAQYANEQLYAYCCDIGNEKDHSDFGDNLLQIDTDEPSPHPKKRTTKKNRITTMLGGHRGDSEKSEEPAPVDNDLSGQANKVERFAEEVQLKKRSMDEDPILLMDNLTAKKEKKKKNKESRGSGSKNIARQPRSSSVPSCEAHDDETIPTSGMEKKPSLDNRIRIKKKTSDGNRSGVESGLDDSHKSEEPTLDERIAMKKKGKRSKDKDGKTKRRGSSIGISSILKKSNSNIDAAVMIGDGEEKKQLHSESGGIQKRQEGETSNSAPQDGSDETGSPERRIRHRHSSPDILPNINGDAPTAIMPNSKGNPHKNTPTMHDYFRGDKLEDDPIMMIDNMMDEMKMKGSKESGEPRRKARGTLAVKNLFKL